MEIPRAIRLAVACLFFSAVMFIPAAAAGTNSDGTGYKIWSGDLPDTVYDLAISDDGAVIAVGTRDGTVSLIDRSGTVLWAYNNMMAGSFAQDLSSDKPTTVALAGDGTFIAAGTRSGGEYFRSPKILFFRRDGTLLWTADARFVIDIAIAAGGERVAAATDNVLAVFDGQGSQLWDAGSLYLADSVSVSDDGSVIAWAGQYNAVSIFDGTGTRIGENYLGQGTGAGSDKEYGEISSDGSVFLVYQNGPTDGTFGLMQKDGEVLWSRTEPNSSANSAAISKDGHYVVVGMRNRVSLFDRKGTELWTQTFNRSTPHFRDSSNDRSYIVDISRDGSVIAAAAYGGAGRSAALSVLSREGDIAWTIPIGDSTRKVALSSDGQYLATASRSMLSLYKTGGGVTTAPAYVDLASGVTYDTGSYVGEYVVPGLFTPANLLIGAFILVIAVAIGYSLRRVKKRLQKNRTAPRISRPVKVLIAGIAILIAARVINSIFTGLYYPPEVMIGSPLNNLVLICTGILFPVSVAVIAGSAIFIVVGYIRSQKP